MFAAAIIFASSPLILASVITFDPPNLKINDNSKGNTFEFIPTMPGIVYLEGPSSILFSQCAFPITAEGVGKPVSVSVGGVPVNGDGKKSASVNVKARLYESSNCTTYDSQYKIERNVGKATTCSSVGDPHFSTSYGAKFSNQDQGYFTLFDSNHLTVQVFQEKVNGGKVSVNKAAAVRYGNEIFVLDVRGRSIPKTASKVLGQSDAKLVVYTPPTKNERKHKFHFTPCSTVVTLSVFEWKHGSYINVNINAAAQYSAAGINGICGSKTAPKNLTPFAVPDVTNILLHPKQAANALSISEPLQGLVHCAIPTTTDACNPSSTSSVTLTTDPPVYTPEPPSTSVSTSDVASVSTSDVASVSTSDVASVSTSVAASASTSSAAPVSTYVPPNFNQTVYTQCTDIILAAKCGNLVEVDFYIKSCISDCNGMESLEPVESTKLQMISDCKTKAENEKCNPDLVKASEASKVEKELGLGYYECPKKCSNNGQCTSDGCVCNAGFSGLYCDINLKSLAQPYSDYSEPIIYPSSAPVYGYTQQLGQVQSYNTTSTSPSYPHDDVYESNAGYESNTEVSGPMYSQASPILPSLVSLSMLILSAIM